MHGAAVVLEQDKKYKKRKAMAAMWDREEDDSGALERWGGGSGNSTPRCAQKGRKGINQTVCSLHVDEVSPVWEDFGHHFGHCPRFSTFLRACAETRASDAFLGSPACHLRICTAGLQEEKEKQAPGKLGSAPRSV